MATDNITRRASLESYLNERYGTMVPIQVLRYNPTKIYEAVHGVAKIIVPEDSFRQVREELERLSGNQLEDNDVPSSGQIALYLKQADLLRIYKKLPGIEQDRIER